MQYTNTLTHTTTMAEKYSPYDFPKPAASRCPTTSTTSIREWSMALVDMINSTPSEPEDPKVPTTADDVREAFRRERELEDQIMKCASVWSQAVDTLHEDYQAIHLSNFTTRGNPEPVLQTPRMPSSPARRPAARPLPPKPTKVRFARTPTRLESPESRIPVPEKYTSSPADLPLSPTSANIPRGDRVRNPKRLSRRKGFRRATN